MARQDAVVVAVHASGESTLVVELLTRDAGRISCVARGARKSSKRFAGGIEVLTRVDVEETPPRKGELHDLVSLDITRDFAGLRQDTLALGRAAYIAELATALTPRNQPSQHMFEFVVDALDRLAQGPAGSGLLRWAEAHLLMIVGDLAPTDACASCGDVLDDAVFVDDGAPGHLYCLNCHPLEGRLLPEAQANLLTSCAHWDVDEAAGAVVDERTSVGVGRWLAPLVNAAAGKPLRSRRFLAQLQRIGGPGRPA